MQLPFDFGTEWEGKERKLLLNFLCNFYYFQTILERNVTDQNVTKREQVGNVSCIYGWNQVYSASLLECPSTSAPILSAKWRSLDYQIISSNARSLKSVSSKSVTLSISITIITCLSNSYFLLVENCRPHKCL